MSFLRAVFPLALGLPALCQTIDVGTGAPNEALRQRFVSAFFRSGFSSLVSLPPLAAVRQFGSTGLIQEFQDAEKTANTRLAIIKANTSTAYPPTPPGADAPPIDTFQVLAAMYAYYSGIGVGAAGYPTTDTLTCPPTAAGPCRYQLFDRNYALFVYQQSSVAGQNFLLRDPYYTSWTTVGGILTLGPAARNESTITSSKGTTAGSQAFAQGAIYRITSGPYNGRTFVIQQPVWDVYAANDAHAGFLGVPISDELALPDGRRRQSFEGGAVEYAPGGGAVVRLPVSAIAVTPAASPVRLNLGDTLTLRATLYAPSGIELTDRQVSWSTSNSRVVSLQPAGPSLLLKAVGGGVAVISVTSEGKSGTPITVVVTAPCCQPGEGAPSVSIQQTFEEAITRHRLSLKLPASNPARRVGAGYLQEFLSADGASRYVIAKPDRSPAAYVVTGAILTRWEQLGGTTGSLGYPASDATPGGRQLFENDSALAGSPVRVVSGGVLAKWAALGYETGPAGPPVGDAAPFLTFTGAGGSTQHFRDGAIYAAQAGAQAGKAFLVRGLILARYTALGGATGPLGMPASDDLVIEGKRRQDFEGGEIEHGPGDTEAEVKLRERRPSVSATPKLVAPGGRVRIVISGFEPGSTLRVSLSGEPDFEVRAEAGSYTWESYVPPSAAGGAVTIRAASAAAAAEGGYQVRSLNEQRVELRKLGGDAQSGLPGAQLPQPLRIALRDESGSPVAGVAVRFTASPGAQVAPASAVTGANGEAEARLRLSAAEGVALVTAEALKQVVTFSALAAASEFKNFPSFMQAGEARLGRGTATIAEKGALLAAAASILRHHQNLGELPAANGLAEPALLNQYLTNFCVFDAQGIEICDGFLSAPGAGDQIVNLWRLAGFLAGNLEVVPEKTDSSSLRDLVALGSPVLVALALTSGDTAMGAHFVVLTGIRADGAIRIHDPNPTFRRGTLEEYLQGFAAGAQNWRGAVAAALRLQPRAASLAGFLVTSGNIPFDVTSPAGACGKTVEWPGEWRGAMRRDLPAAPPEPFRARYCEGVQAVHQLAINTEDAYQLAVTDLGNLGSRFDLAGRGAAAFRLTRPAGRLAVAPQDVSFEAGAVVNAASFTGAIAPGGIIAIFGSGLARPGGRTEVEIDGVACPVLAATPFQVNAQAPLELAPGTHSLRVRSPYGVREQTINLEPTAPAIFLLEGGRGAVVNQDGSLNSPASPARRGQAVTVYCTGLGAVTRVGALLSTSTSVTVVLDGSELPVSFSGLTPGFVGLYQVNVTIPAVAAPRLEGLIALRQDGRLSNSVAISIR